MAAAPAVTERATRLASIDIIRGAVMVLMAIDHVRVFAAVPAGGADPAIFFTRWITHFCAPAFLFLAGSSAFLHGRQAPGLSRFLLTRGLWLIVLELTVIRVSWTFNVDFRHYALAGVIWVIGWCMILMAGLVKLRLKTIAMLGVGMIALHNAIMPPLMELGPASLLWLKKILYVGFFAGPMSAGPDGPNLIVLYTIVPWIGVMMAGYAFGWVLTLDAARRDKLCYAIGLGAIALFVVLRALDVYGDPSRWAVQRRGSEWSPPMPALRAFLNTRKYPASLLFLLMTLGPVIALMPALERARGRVAGWLTAFGRVPFFFYLLHIPLIHALAIVVALLTTGAVPAWLFANHPMGAPEPPAGYAWELPLMYLVWAIAVVLLYFPSRWFARVKAQRREWWLTYL